MARTRRSLTLVLALLAGATEPARAEALDPAWGAEAWRRSSLRGVRGLTVGPIESALHPNKGYGTRASTRTFEEARRLGATWVSLTPFGRVFDLSPSGVDPTFEAPFPENRAAILRAIEQAHANGLRVLLVPHLWVETGKWRALIDPGSDEAWDRWADGYGRFVLEWAKVAQQAHADMFSVGVELRNWVTTSRAPSFVEVIHSVRQVYSGILTYAANWDDVHETVILGELDVIGINAFYPLSDEENAPFEALLKGGAHVADETRELAERWEKPVVFTEIGYTTRPDPAVRPWEWPDAMTNVTVDQRAQAEAFAALLAPFFDEPWFAGFFVWRVYSDPDDMSQEAEWGFSPRGKLAELVVRDAFGAHFAADGLRPIGAALCRDANRGIGLF